MDLIKFLPSYVGSKAYWVERLRAYEGEFFVEVFCGSAVLSANLAKEAILNDVDPIIFKVLSNYSKQIVPKIFTSEDYFKKRIDKNWWRYLYCLQKMSFSGVFRYSKNGFNVPIKKNLTKVEAREQYLMALKKFKSIKPTVLNLSFEKIPFELYKDKVVVFDPPYEGSQAAYNKSFDYESYWKLVREVSKVAKTVLIFDTEENLKKQNFPIEATRKMRVNGKHQGSLEALSVLGENRVRNHRQNL